MGINSDVDIIWITSLLYTGVHQLAQLLHYFHSVLLVFVTGPGIHGHLQSLPLLSCAALAWFFRLHSFHTYHYSLYPVSLWKLHSAWIIPEQGLEMDVPANCECLPRISPGVCQPCPAADASTTGQDGHTGVPTAIYTIHTNHKGTVPPNPAQFPGAAVPFLPTPS